MIEWTFAFKNPHTPDSTPQRHPACRDFHIGGFCTGLLAGAVACISAATRHESLDRIEVAGHSSGVDQPVSWAKIALRVQLILATWEFLSSSALLGVSRDYARRHCPKGLKLRERHQILRCTQKVREGVLFHILYLGWSG
jgi:hypothetical protein